MGEKQYWRQWSMVVFQMIPQSQAVGEGANTVRTLPCDAGNPSAVAGNRSFGNQSLLLTFTGHNSGDRWINQQR